MNSRPGIPRAVVLFSLAAMASGCKPNPIDTTENVLPGQDSGADDATTGEITMGIPATYRFSCMDVQVLGSADADSIQAGLMEGTWGSDIAGFRLNLLVDFLSLDEAAGTGELMVRSGVGSNNNDQCSEANSDSQVFPVTFQPGVSVYAADDTEGFCSKEDASAPAFGSFQLDLNPDCLLYTSDAADE